MEVNDLGCAHNLRWAGTSYASNAKPVKTKARCYQIAASGLEKNDGLKAATSGAVSVFRLGLDDFAATVKPGWADVVAQMGFTRGGFHGNAGHVQGIV